MRIAVGDAGAKEHGVERAGDLRERGVDTRALVRVAVIVAFAEVVDRRDVDRDHISLNAATARAVAAPMPVAAPTMGAALAVVAKSSLLISISSRSGVG